MKHDVQRRRFYLSDESLKTLDEVADKNNTTPSIVLDILILKLQGEGYFKQLIITKEV